MSHRYVSDEPVLCWRIALWLLHRPLSSLVIAVTSVRLLPAPSSRICASTGMTCLWTWRALIAGSSTPIILAQIAARTHFLVILTHGTLEGCQEPDDWLRREIERAMELGRNVIPILVNDFRFDEIPPVPT